MSALKRRGTHVSSWTENRFNYREIRRGISLIPRTRSTWIIALLSHCECAHTSGTQCKLRCFALRCFAVVHQFYLGKCETMRNVGQMWVDSLCVRVCVCLGLFIWVMHRSSLKGKHAPPPPYSYPPAHAACQKATPISHAVLAKQITRSRTSQEWPNNYRHSHTRPDPSRPPHTHSLLGNQFLAAISDKR